MGRARAECAQAAARHTNARLRSCAGRLWAISGFRDGGELLSTEYLTLSNPTAWTLGPNLTIPRRYGGVTTVDQGPASGRLYLLGGMSSFYGDTRTVDYINVNNAIVAGPPMAVNRSTCGAVFTGPYSEAARHRQRSARVLARSAAAAARRSAPTKFARVCVCARADKIYVLGGTTGSNFLSSVEVLDLSSNTWSTGPKMQAVRSTPGAVYAGPTYRACSCSGVLPTPRCTFRADSAARSLSARVRRRRLPAEHRRVPRYCHQHVVLGPEHDLGAQHAGGRLRQR